ncbi:hypothetical protein DU52_00320 [Methanosarcina mazei]|uniref:Uncharacterized protein n=1 Tax=Methanosarcina mazei TaxID=2209 RepID=A0A0F8E3Y8_METMZ|nr:hypothetical protein DU30_14235 [Methanosarcina mazei]KKG36520.1 hypothetical protein DU52_00320 [Methanosarcina mazei]KKG59346.1 hypothetical protein DU67_03530 [Methanosarcina mazei]KKH31418.1 hypothetical protein DU58_09150 [Methanosarcina mazei]QCR16333.1 hypothetical protein DKM28_10150 [Methanosarcina mazei]
MLGTKRSKIVVETVLMQRLGQKIKNRSPYRFFSDSYEFNKEEYSSISQDHICRILFSLCVLIILCNIKAWRTESKNIVLQFFSCILQYLPVYKYYGQNNTVLQNKRGIE